MPRLFGDIAALLGEDPEQTPENQAAPLEPGEQHPEMPQYQYKYGNTDEPREAMLQKLQDQALAKADPRIEQLRNQGLAAPEDDSGFHPGKLMLNILQFSPKLGGFARAKLNEIEGRKGTDQAARKQALDEAARLEEAGLSNRNALRSDLSANRDEEKYQSDLQSENELNDINSPSRQFIQGLIEKGVKDPRLQALLPNVRGKQLNDLFGKTMQTANFEAARQDAASRFAESRANREINKENTDRNFQAQQDEKVAKKNTAVTEVEEKIKTLTDNADAVINMIKDKGTYETVGPHNEIMRRMVDTMANDMSKLTDPSSKVTASEVATWRANLVDPTSMMSNSTAVKNLESFKQEVLKRRNTAYKARGLTPPEELGDAPGSAPKGSFNSLTSEDVVKMRDPQGNIRMVPKANVEAATKAGGQVVQ